MVDDESVIQDRMGHAVGRSLRMFYDTDGLLGSRDTELLQRALNILIKMFWRIGLAANSVKSKTMMFQAGVIILGMLEEEFGCCSTGEGTSYLERLRIKSPCLYCRVEMTAGSMTDHFWKIYETNPDIV